MRCLLTAFEPFGGELLNPSLEVARALRVRPVPGVSLKVLELPVDRIGAIEYALRELRGSGFDAVVMLGEAGGRFGVTPERVAINVDDYRMPDNAGHQPRNEPVLAHAPSAYFSSLPVDAIVHALHARAIPAAVSNSAGTYLCNRLFYCVMHELAQKTPTIPAGFVHLPYLHEQAVTKSMDVPSLSRATMIDAVACLLDVLAGSS